MIGLEAHGSSLLQDGLVSRMEAVPHHGDGVRVVVVARSLVIVIVAGGGSSTSSRLVSLSLLLVSQ